MRKHHLFQGRSEEQIKNSYYGGFFSLVALLVLMLLSIIFNLL